MAQVASNPLPVTQPVAPQPPVSNVVNKVNNVFASAINAWVGTTTATTNISNNSIIVTNNSTNSSFVVQGGTLGAWTTDDYYETLLSGDGIDLKDGRRLKLEDGEPIVIFKHDDGNTSKKKIPFKHGGVIDVDRHLIDIDKDTVLRLPNGSYIAINEKGEVYRQRFKNAREEIIDLLGGNVTLYEGLAFSHFKHIHIPKGTGAKATFILPNKVKINLHTDDTVEIDDSEGTQIYKSQPIRDFNRFLNASDLLEEFIAYCAKQNMSKKEFSELPISLFIYWLIVRAAETDGDSTAEVLPMLTSAVRERKMHTHKCKCCGRFLTKAFLSHSVSFCNAEHMQSYMTRANLG